MRPKICDVFLLVLCSCGLVSVADRPVQAQPYPATAEQTDEVRWRALAEKLYAAYAQKDAAAYFQRWSAQTPWRSEQQRTLQRQWAGVAQLTLLQLQLVSAQREGARAAVRFELTWQITKAGQLTQLTQARKLECVWEAETWKVWRELSPEDEFAETLVAANETERTRLLAAQAELVNAELAQSLLAQGRQQSNFNQYARAVASFQLARDVAQHLSDRKTLGQALNNLGSALRGVGQYEQALEALHQSLALKDAEDRAGRATSLAALGLVYQARGEFPTALEYFRQSLVVREALGEPAARASTLTHLGNNYFGQGLYRQALEYYQRSLSLRAADGGTLHNIGNIYRHQGNYPLAQEYYQRALALWQQANNRVTEAMAWNSLASVYLLQGKYAEAEATLQKVLSLYTAENKEGLATAWNNLGVFYQQQGDAGRARAALQQSVALNEELQHPWQLSESLMNLAWVQHCQGQSAQALTPVARAVALARQSRHPDAVWSANLIAGQIYRALKRPAQARAAFTEAIQTVEAQREEVAGDQTERVRFFESKVKPYLLLMELALAENRPVEALELAERAKARVLLDVLQRGYDGSAVARSAAEREQEQRLQTELFTLNAQLYQEQLRAKPEPARLAELQTRLQQARMRQEAFQHVLAAAHPLARAQRAHLPALNLPELTANLLDARTALLEYVVTEQQTFLFVLTSGAPPINVKVYELAVARAQLGALLETFRQQLATRNLGFRPTAARLYELLLKPAAAQLQGKTKLVIVRDGELWELPFQALTTDKGRFLLEDYSIAYAPSLTTLAELVNVQRRRRQANINPVLVAFGNPQLGASAKADAAPLRSGARLVPLPSTETEVKRVARFYGAEQSKLYLGAAAREEAFKAEAGHAGILHLATHALLNDASPLYSQIVLTQDTGTNAPIREDGLLEAWEVLKLKLRAELVVLSACETGRGRLGAGEGLIGLTWAFFMAGAPATIVSQWQVDAESTAALMQDFHRHWRTPSIKGASPTKAAALRAAALKLLRTREYHHPFFWASFSLIGEPF
jgi:CHAT domain-containing protein/Flp pilus assembly protein TadD